MKKKKKIKTKVINENAYINENGNIKKSTGLSKKAKILLG